MRFCTTALPVHGLLLAIGLLGSPGWAQVLPDNSLGAESSIVTPLAGNRDRIDGGALRDSVLFHSFEQFGIPENHGVYFANPDVVNTIFGRVTGTDPSLLFGTLGVLGEADLVFLNPNGILFGPNAKLDLRGAFTATTAGEIMFLGGDSFSAVEPEAAPLLSVNMAAPIGLVFGDELGAIANAGTLAVAPAQGLALIGSVVVNEGSLTAPAGQVSLAAVPADNLVQIASSGQVLSWEHEMPSQPTETFDADSVNNLVNTLGLNIVGDLNAGTNLVSGEVDVSSSTSSGGDIQVLGDRIALLDAHLNASGQTDGGNLLIGGNYQGQGPLPTATQTYFGQDSTVQADALHVGDGGRVIVWADGSTHFYGDISARGGVNSGDGGFVEVSGRENLAFQGFVDAGADNGANGTLLLDPLDIVIREGDAGNPPPIPAIDGDANRSIVLPWQQNAPNIDNEFIIAEEDLERIDADVDIRLEASRHITIESLNGPGEDNDTELLFSGGPGGSITFVADADGDGEGQFTMQSTDTIVARQRNIEILAAEITVGSINTTVPVSDQEDLVPVNGGDITLRALRDITVAGVFDGVTIDDDNSNFSPNALGSFVSNGRTGNGGDITLISQLGDVNTSIEEITGEIDSSSPEGNSGNIIIQAAGEIKVDSLSSGIRNTLEQGVGVGGRIELISTNGEIDTTDGIISSSSPDGDGGEILIRAENEIFTGRIDSSSDRSGNAGDITIVSGNSFIDTTEGQIDATSSDGDGGRVLFIAEDSITTQGIRTSFGSGLKGDTTLISRNGAIDIGGIINSFFEGDNVDITGEDTVTFGTVYTDAGDLDVEGGIIEQRQFSTARVGGTALFNSTVGNITLGNVISNDLIVTSSGSISGQGRLDISRDSTFTSSMEDAGTVTLESRENIAFGNSVVGGNLLVNSEGDVSQVGVLQVAGDIEVNGDNSNGADGPLINTVGDPNQETTSADGSVTITQVGTVSLEAREYAANLTVNSLSEGILGFDEVLEETAIDLSNPSNSFGGTIQFRTAIGDAETISGIPGITQSGPISVDGTAIFDATEAGNIELTSVDNQFNEVEFVGSNVNIASSNGFELLTSTASENLSIQAGGALEQASVDSVLSVGGETNLTITGPELGNVTLGNAAPVTEIGQSLIGGDLNLNLQPASSLRQTPGATLQVAGNLDTAIVQNNTDADPSNDFELGTLPSNELQTDTAGNIFITDIGPTDVSEILRENGIAPADINGNLTVNSLEEGLQFDGRVFNIETAIDLGNSDNRLQGPITITTDAPEVVVVSGTPEINQSTSLAVDGTATFNAVSGNVNLTETANQFGSVAFEGVDITIREQGPTVLDSAIATGRLDLTSSGTITQQGALKIDGASSFTTLEADAPITLDQANQLAGPITFNTEGTSNVTVTNTVNDTQLAESSIGGDLTINSGSAITQTGAITVSGTATLNTGSNEISLLFNNDFNELAVTGSGTVDIRDINTLNLLDSRSFDNFTITAQDTISSNDIFVSNGTIQLTSEAGNINTTGGLLRAQFLGGQGGNVNLRAREDLTVGEILVSGFPSGNVSLTAENGTLLLDDFDVQSVTFGSGTGGTVTLNGDIVELANGGRVLAIAADTGTGGTVNVNARQFLIQGIDSNGSFNQNFITGIGTDTLPGTAANGGNQNIRATELIQITGTRLEGFTPDQTDPLAVFEAGALRTGLTASSLGSGKAGDINLSTDRLVLQNGVGVATAALGQDADAGDGGQVTVTARDIEFRGLAGLASATLGQGIAGNIVVRGPGSTDAAPVPANQLFLFDGAVITADAIPEASPELIEAFNLGDNPPVLTGRAGNIDITVNDILLDKNALITTSSTTGSGGNITLDNVGLLRLRRGNGIGGIITDGGTLRRTGDGGQIDITADLIFAVDGENSDISATAFIGRGGGIEITTLTDPIGIEFRPDLTPLSDITAGSDQGPQGTVDVNTSSLDPTQGTDNLPDQPSAPEIIQGCRVSGNREATQFFDNGRGGIRPQPEDSVASEVTAIDWLNLELADTTEANAGLGDEETASDDLDDDAIALCSFNLTTH